MTGGDGAVYDRGKALEQLGGDEALFGDVSAVFIAECESYCTALEAVLADGDVAMLRLEAHTVKSVLASFACEAGRELAQRLEHLAASGSIEGADSMTSDLVAAMRRLAVALKKETR